MNALFTASAFNLTEQNVLSSDPANPNNSIQTGEICSRGVELQAKAKSNDGTVGFRPYAIPRDSANLWTGYRAGAERWRPLHRRDDGSVQYAARPAYELFDATVRYDLGDRTPSFRGVSLAVNVTNLFDKTCIQQCVSGRYYGARRAVRGMLKYDW